MKLTLHPRVSTGTLQQTFSKGTISAIILCAIILLITTGNSYAKPTRMTIKVDATELPRKLLHATTQLPATGNKMSILYPKWIPGIHGPRGPVQNIAGIEVTDNGDAEIKWERDWSEVYRFFVYPNRGNSQINWSLTYITNQPSTNSIGIDSYGTPDLGIINWNTILVYPEGIPIRDLEITATLILPSGWSFGSALEVDRVKGDTVTFKAVSVEELVDSPLLCGRNFRTIEIGKTDMATYYLHVAADDEGDLPRADDSVMIPMKRLPKEAEALYGRTHFSSYHFLLSLSDAIPGTGLEHRSSSLNGVKANEWRDADWSKKRSQYLLTHEFSHAWCGKYRRPAGMYTDDFQSDKDTDLLWVYEGLDQYLGNVLGVRCGFATSDEFIERMGMNMGGLMLSKGRSWRPLRDTEVSGYILRGGSRSWSSLRRGQDYYREGAMLWLSFDGRIRNLTDGKKSLDDFCAAFFSNGDPSATAVPFDIPEIVKHLSAIADAPWDSLINAAIRTTHDRYDGQAAIQTGYRLSYSDKKPKVLKNSEERYKYASFSESIGITTNQSGKVSDVVKGSSADIAGLFPGSQIAGVNGKKFTMKRLEDAIENSVTEGEVRLLVLRGDDYDQLTLKYDDGLRYYKLIPVDGKPDWLSEIAKPLIDTK